MLGFFKSKEQKVIDQVEKHFKQCKKAADAIVALDVEHNKEKIIRLAEIFNKHNVTALRILYLSQGEFKWLKKNPNDEIDFVNKKYNYIRDYIPYYYMSKKDYKKFEEVTQNAVMGIYGEYKGL